MYLSLTPCSSLIVFPSVFPLRLPCFTLPLPGPWRGLITLCRVYPRPQICISHTLQYSLSSLCTCPHLDCLLHPHPLLYSVSFLLSLHIDKMHTHKGNPLFHEIARNVICHCLETISFRAHDKCENMYKCSSLHFSISDIGAPDSYTDHDQSCDM